MDILERNISSRKLCYNNAHTTNSNNCLIYFSRQSPFGQFLVAFTTGSNANELCYLKFFDTDQNQCVENLRKLFPKFSLKENLNFVPADNELQLLLKGTEFQVAVWNELLNIKKGTTVSYEYVANAIGKPKSVRAVANAIGKNPISYLIPCHRVIRKNATIGGYQSGLERKIRMLRYEGIDQF